METSSIIISVFSSAIGAGYFLYGKKQSRYITIACGVGLCILPMLISSWGWALVVCAVLAIIPWFYHA